MATRPMRYAHAWAAANQLAPAAEAEFKKALHQMWFSFYGRGEWAEGLLIPFIWRRRVGQRECVLR